MNPNVVLCSATSRRQRDGSLAGKSGEILRRGHSFIADRLTLP
jgi:hypothetical protein